LNKGIVNVHDVMAKITFHADIVHENIKNKPTEFNFKRNIYFWENKQYTYFSLYVKNVIKMYINKNITNVFLVHRYLFNQNSQK